GWRSALPRKDRGGLNITVVPDKRSAITDAQLRIGGSITTDVNYCTTLERQPVRPQTFVVMGPCLRGDDVWGDRGATKKPGLRDRAFHSQSVEPFQAASSATAVSSPSVSA